MKSISRPPPFSDATDVEKHVCENTILMGHAPGEHLLGVGEVYGCVGRIVAAVDELVRVLFKVEEQRRQGGEVHVFVLVVTDRG